MLNFRFLDILLHMQKRKKTKMYEHFSRSEGSFVKSEKWLQLRQWN